MNPWQPTQALANHMNQIGRDLRARADGALSSVPMPTVVPPQVVQPRMPPHVGESTLTQTALLQSMANSLSQLVRLTSTVAAQNDLLLRMNWVAMVSNSALSPGRVVPPTLGSGGNNYTSGTFQSFFQNLAKYPVGIFVYAQWNTPGGRILLSLTQNSQNLVGDISNGGPSGGTLTAPIIVNPGQIIYAANFDPNVVLTANDKFFIRMLDYSGFINPSVFQAPPWTYPGMP